MLEDQGDLRDNLNKILNGCKLDENIRDAIGNMVVMQKTLYDGYVNVGFMPDQALQLVMNQQMSATKH